jgi:hypothetical protein
MSNSGRRSRVTRPTAATSQKARIATLKSRGGMPVKLRASVSDSNIAQRSGEQ